MEDSAQDHRENGTKLTTLQRLAAMGPLRETELRAQLANLTYEEVQSLMSAAVDGLDGLRALSSSREWRVEDGASPPSQTQVSCLSLVRVELETALVVARNNSLSAVLRASARGGRFKMFKYFLTELFFGFVFYPSFSLPGR